MSLPIRYNSKKKITQINIDVIKKRVQKRNTFLSHRLLFQISETPTFELTISMFLCVEIIITNGLHYSFFTASYLSEKADSPSKLVTFKTATFLLSTAYLK